MPSNRKELTALKNLLSETEIILSTTTLPEGRAERALEFVRAAKALANDLLKQEKLPAAAVLGSRGGSQTAKRGSDYFRQLAAKRKTLGGGRPRKPVE
jgi:hypothetical protein